MTYENIVLCVFNPLNLIQNLYHRFPLSTEEYLYLGGKGVKIYFENNVK